MPFELPPWETRPRKLGDGVSLGGCPIRSTGRPLQPSSEEDWGINTGCSPHDVDFFQASQPQLLSSSQLILAPESGPSTLRGISFAEMKISLIIAVLPLALGRPSTLRRREQPAPVLRARDDQAIPNKYIVVLNQEEGEVSIQSTVDTLGVEPDHVYDAEGFRGFSAELDDDALATLQDDPTVSLAQYIEIGSIGGRQHPAQSNLIALHRSSTSSRMLW